MNSLFPNSPAESSKQPLKTLDHTKTSNEMESCWSQIISKLQDYIGVESIGDWISPVKLSFDINQILIHVPNMIFYERFISEILPTINKIKSSLELDSIQISVQLTRETEKVSKITAENQSSKEDEIKNHEQSYTVFSSKLSKSTGLNPNYTFDNFVRGPSNQFSHATCLNVADNPGQSYNPLFIYGHSGLGKTHLLHAVGNRILARNPNAVIVFTNSDTFMNEMIYCLRHNKMWEFKQKYRHCDTLLVDDIQFISGKKSTQEEFFHTFNTLYNAKKQIVITSDKFPQEISDIEERLRNRFQWGLIADIQPPDTEHRMAILLSKAEELGINLTQDVAEFIATKWRRNVRELEGALRRIAAFAAFHGRPINKNLAMETFQHVVGDQPKKINTEAIQKIVAEHFNLRISDLKSKKRQRNISVPRQIAFYLTREFTGASFPEIGEKFGGKDHTTVMHGVKKIETELSKDMDLKAHIESLKRNIEQYQ